LDIQDKYFDIRQTGNCFLSGQVDLAGFSFAVTDTTGACKALKKLAYRRAVLNYDDWAQELDTLFHDEPLLQSSFKSSAWMLLSNKATLIPNNFVQPGQLRTALEYAVELDELDEIHYRLLPNCDAVSVFAVPSPPAGIISKYQTQTRFLHQQVQLITLANKLAGANRIVLQVTPTLADIVLFADNKLVLSNSYLINTFTDVLYHLLLVTKQLHLLFSQVQLYYTGDIDSKDIQLLHRYYRHVQPLHAEAAQIDENTATTFHALLTLSQCE